MTQTSGIMFLYFARSIKEIAAGLDEESNPVIMPVKYKGSPPGTCI
jgi:hypothetical protein